MARRHLKESKLLLRNHRSPVSACNPVRTIQFYDERGLRYGTIERRITAVDRDSYEIF